MVVGAAEDLILKGGLPQLTVRKIAAKIGYTVGSIYMVFENMDDLTLHIKGRTLDAIAEKMSEVQSPSAEQNLDALARVYIKFATQNLNRWSMVFVHRVPEEAEVPGWYQKKLDNVYEKIEAQFVILAPELSRAQRRQMALAYLGGIHGICVLMLPTQIAGLSNKDMEKSASLLTRLFVGYDLMASTSGITPFSKLAIEACI